MLSVIDAVDARVVIQLTFYRQNDPKNGPTMTPNSPCKSRI